MLGAMPLETLELQTGGDPVASIIVLHGLGADGNDFVPIARELDLAAIGAVRFVFPHAPIRPPPTLPARLTRQGPVPPHRMRPVSG